MSVPYKERIVLVGAGQLRDGEEHAAHPDVMAIVTRSRDRSAEEAMPVELWIRAADDRCDAEGHSIFLHVDDVTSPAQVHPDARPMIVWKRLKR